MSEWVLLALAGLNLLVLLVLLFRSKTAPEEDADKAAKTAADQMAWQLQQFAAVQAQTARLERELRTEIGQSGVQGRQEAMQTLTLFQQSLLQQSAEATRTQNQQIDALAQQLIQLRNDHLAMKWGVFTRAPRHYAWTLLGAAYPAYSSPTGKVPPIGYLSHWPTIPHYSYPYSD